MTSFAFLTAPPNSTPSRRTDPFGLAEVADAYAELLAPGISGRHNDARWLTLLCWILREVAQVGGRLSNEERQTALRSLELAVVAASCPNSWKSEGRSLPGSRAVRRYRDGKASSIRAAMTESGWNRYRYIGPYGAHRRLMQDLGLVKQDGWSLTEEGTKLAESLAVPASDRKLRLKDGDWEGFWARRLSLQLNAKFKPRSPDGLALPNKEAEHLKQLLFERDDDALRRKVVATCLGKSESATADSHVKLCEVLQGMLLNENGGWTHDERTQLCLLHPFARLADALVNALKSAFDLADAECTMKSASEKVKSQLQELHQAAGAWVNMTSSPWPQVNNLASVMWQVNSDEALLRALIQAHMDRCGGAKWIVLRLGCLDRSVQHRFAPGGLYRFRLKSLARLATGTKLITAMPNCLANEVTATDEEGSDD